MIRQRISLAVAGAVVATTALTAGLALPASATESAYDPGFTSAAGDLVVPEAQANMGPGVQQGGRPRAQGRAFPIHQPMTHITIVVEDREA